MFLTMFVFIYFIVGLLLVGPGLWRYHIVPCGVLGWYLLFCIVWLSVRICPCVNIFILLFCEL